MDREKDLQLALSEFLFIIEQSIHMLYCFSNPDDIDEYFKDIDPDNRLTASDRKFASLNYEQYVSQSVHAHFDRFFRNNRDLYDVLNKDTGAKIFGDYLLCFTNDPIQYDWSINKELWTDNETDTSINADDEQRALGNIHTYRIFEPILGSIGRTFVSQM